MMNTDEMRKKACCFTGHRVIPAAELTSLPQKTEDTVRRLIAKGFVFFIAGGALGFDTLAAETVLRLRDTEFPHIYLLLAIPCENQAAAWPPAEKLRYAKIKEKANKVRILAEHYYNGCMQVRNRYMVDHASVCVSFSVKSTGGTASTIRYAKKEGLAVINLADDRAQA